MMRKVKCTNFSNCSNSGVEDAISEIDELRCPECSLDRHEVLAKKRRMKPIRIAVAVVGLFVMVVSMWNSLSSDLYLMSCDTKEDCLNVLFLELTKHGGQEYDNDILALCTPNCKVELKYIDGTEDLGSVVNFVQRIKVTHHYYYQVIDVQTSGGLITRILVKDNPM